MKRTIAIVAIGLLLGACSPVGDSIRDTGGGGAIVIGSGSGVASGSTSTPMAPPGTVSAETQNTASNPTYKNAAVIGVEKKGHCSQLEQHLQKHGLDVTLIEIIFEGNSDGRELHYSCHFEGEDCGNFDVNDNAISLRTTWVNPLRYTGRLK